MTSERKSCCGSSAQISECDPCSPPSVEFGTDCNSGPLAYFEDMIDHCLDYAEEAKKNGSPIVGIMCEYAPRELIMAAGGVPICLCGGSSKTIPAAEEHLPANLCPLIKSTYGYHLTGTNPFLEMADLIVAETTCDGKKKMFELMSETRPVHLIELPQKEDDPDSFDHWLKELHKFREALETRFGTEITPEKLRNAIYIMNRERGLRRKLASLMKSDSPPIAGRQLLDFKSQISGIPADLEQYEKAIEMLTVTPCAQDMTSRVRVLLTGVPVAHGAERVIDIIESNGGLIVCQENCTGLKPILEDVETEGDLMQNIARKYFRLHCAVMTKNSRRMDYLKELALEYRAECVIDLIWQACQIYDIESFSVKRLSENELRLPYMRIETDYSPSDSARIAVRVEALYETVREGRAAACCK